MFKNNLVVYFVSIGIIVVGCFKECWIKRNKTNLRITKKDEKNNLEGIKKQSIKRMFILLLNWNQIDLVWKIFHISFISIIICEIFFIFLTSHTPYYYCCCPCLLFVNNQKERKEIIYEWTINKNKSVLKNSEK